MGPKVRLVAVTLLAFWVLVGCDAPKVIDLDPKEHTFKRVGEDVWWQAKVRTKRGKFLQTKTVTWSSADPKVVEIDAKGRAKAVGLGRTTIVANSGSLRFEAPVEVLGVGKVTVEPAEGLTLDARGAPKAITVAVFDPAGHPMRDRTAMARCESEDVCRVFGKDVYGVDSGETTLVVSCEGAKATLHVKVLPTEEERKAKGLDGDKPARAPKRR